MAAYAEAFLRPAARCAPTRSPSPRTSASARCARCSTPRRGIGARGVRPGAHLQPGGGRRSSTPRGPTAAGGAGAARRRPARERLGREAGRAHWGSVGVVVGATVGDVRSVALHLAVRRTDPRPRHGGPGRPSRAICTGSSGTRSGDVLPSTQPRGAGRRTRPRRAARGRRTGPAGRRGPPCGQLRAADLTDAPSVPATCVAPAARQSVGSSLAAARHAGRSERSAHRPCSEQARRPEVT